MVAILPALFMLMYFGGIIALVIYMVLLFIRLVKAVEKIANSAENCSKSK